MVEPDKKLNLYIIPDKDSYREIVKYIHFLSEEKSILYLDFSYDNNKAITNWSLTYQTVSYYTAQSEDEFRNFVKKNLFNIDTVIIDINGNHNLWLVEHCLDLFSHINLNILCLNKRSLPILDSRFRFSEIYFVTDKIKIASSESESDFESYKKMYIRDLKLNKLI